MSKNTIKDAIEKDIDDGTLAPGARLPTETELQAIYATGRHSVRRAPGAKVPSSMSFSIASLMVF
ncbi:MAG: GntR family transcriptional regulator, partial [Pseudomonadota bacterium]